MQKVQEVRFADNADNLLVPNHRNVVEVVIVKNLFDLRKRVCGLTVISLVLMMVEMGNITFIIRNF